MKKSCSETNIINNFAGFSEESGFDTICSRCNELVSSDETCYVPVRKDLQTLLKSSLNGQIILAYFEHNHELSDNMQSYLTKIVIDQEMEILFKKKNASLQNPLQKIEVPSNVLIDAANQISCIFKLRSNIFYSPGFYKGNKSVGPVGKFVSRINYMRIVLQEAGLFQHSIPTSKPQNLLEIDDSENEIAFLKEPFNQENWSKVIEAWEKSYPARNVQIKDKNDGGLWQFLQFPCLASARASELILLDFKQKYPDCNINIKDTWPELRNCFKDLILAKQINADEVQDLIQSLSTLSNDKLDPVILLLLPYAFKSTTWITSYKSAKSAGRKRKLESEETINNRKREFQTFIVQLGSVEELQSHIRDKQEKKSTSIEGEKPYLTFIGSGRTITHYFIVFGQVWYECASPAETLDLALKIYLANDCFYPKETYFVWLSIQRICLRLQTSKDKSSVGFSKVLSFFDNLGISVN